MYSNIFMEVIKMTLGDVIKNFRLENKMTQREFSQKSGLSVPYISQLERNRNPKTGAPPVPSMDTFRGVATATGIDIFGLLNMVDENDPPYIEYYIDGERRRTFAIKDFIAEQCDEIGTEFAEIIECYTKLNEEGKETLLDYARYLLSSCKYKKRNESKVVGEE